VAVHGLLVAGIAISPFQAGVAAVEVVIPTVPKIIETPAINTVIGINFFFI
jgi:flagellar biosynthesis protein FliQ